MELIRLEGNVDKAGPRDEPVRNLCFRGLTFMHGERYSLAEDDKGLQHDWDMHDKANALVRLRGAENCTIEQCHFVHSGGGAIRVDLHGQENRIVGNHIEHIGGTGVLLCGYGPGTKDVNKNNLVIQQHPSCRRDLLAFAGHIRLAERRESRRKQPDPPHAIHGNDRLRMHDPFLPKA
ncbi:MAG: right-handed parallel beta-helix repeat-containing protein [Planctomycetota bacterium]